MPESKDILSTKKLYMILSVATKRPYVDKDGSGYAFSAKKEAEEYIKALGHDKVYMEGTSAYISQNKDIKELYCMGMKRLKVKIREKDDLDVIPLRKSDVSRGYYNTALEFNVTRLKETSLRKYLEAMKENTFLVPVFIAERKAKEYPKLYYCHAVLQDKHEALVLFSMMNEFRDWNDGMKRHKGEEFYPLEISATRVLKVRGKADLLINPLTDKLYIEAKDVK